MSIPLNPGRAPVGGSTPQAHNRRMNSGPKAGIGAGILVLLVGIVAIFTAETVPVKMVEECVQRAGKVYERAKIFGVTLGTSGYWLLADGRKVSFADRDWSLDAFGNLCRTTYVPKGRAGTIPTASSVQSDKRDDDCKTWDWDFSPSQGSIGFRCHRIDPGTFY